ncbi:MAG: radical SAM protein [Thermodesulfobacteriota bacterium]
MEQIYAETIALCPMCAKDSPAFYEEKKDGMYLHAECAEHGRLSEKMESDAAFFRDCYEQEYEKPYSQLLLPITYRCNVRCRYCYTLSNTKSPRPGDRSAETLLAMIREFEAGSTPNGNLSLIGGEPTVRKDLMHIVRSAKDILGEKRLDLATNGLKLRDPEFVKELKENGLDFVFLNVNDVVYEESHKLYMEKVEALNNCMRFNMPVWLQRTIDDLSQVDSLLRLAGEYRRIVFKLTIRVAAPYGSYAPINRVFVSELIRHLKKDGSHTQGRTPFNREVRLCGKRTKLSRWPAIIDVRRLDPIDPHYIISDDTLTAFHRGMKVDEMLMMDKRLRTAGRTTA